MSYRHTPPPSIKAVGLEKWINGGYVTSKWRCSYTDFVEYRHKLQLTKRKMATLFGVTANTMAYWWQIDDEERG